MLTCNKQAQWPEGCVPCKAAQHQNQQDCTCVAKHGAHGKECIQALLQDTAGATRAIMRK